MKKLCYRAMDTANRRKLECPDFGISCGLRTKGEQQALFNAGMSNADGFNSVSKHQLGTAVDIYAYVDGKANYEPGNLALVFSCFQQAALDLNLKIRWGGNFNSIADGPHIELVSG